MSEELLVYLVMQASSFKACIVAIFVCSLVLSAASCIHYLAGYDYGVALSLSKKSLVVSLVFLILNSFVPSTKTLSAVFIIPKVMRSESFKNLDSLGVEATETLKDLLKSFHDDSTEG